MVCQWQIDVFHFSLDQHSCYLMVRLGSKTAIELEKPNGFPPITICNELHYSQLTTTTLEGTLNSWAIISMNPIFDGGMLNIRSIGNVPFLCELAITLASPSTWNSCVNCCLRGKWPSPHSNCQHIQNLSDPNPFSSMPLGCHIITIYKSTGGMSYKGIASIIHSKTIYTFKSLAIISFLVFYSFKYAIGVNSIINSFYCPTHH